MFPLSACRIRVEHLPRARSSLVPQYRLNQETSPVFQRASSPIGIGLLLVLVVASSPIISGLAWSQPTRGKAQPAVTITLIHMGDLQGHLVQSQNVRSDATGKTDGGIVSWYTIF